MVVLAGCSGDTEQAATSSTSSTPAATTSSAPTPSTTPSPTSETSSTSEEPTSEEPTTSAPPPTSTPSSTTRRTTRTATPTERDSETETDEPERESATATPTRRETPRGRIVRIDDYCDDTPWEVARTADGRTAYCVQVYATDAFVWSRTFQMRTAEPGREAPGFGRYGPAEGGPCHPDGVTIRDGEGRLLRCTASDGGGEPEWRRAG
ncbi:hypothetical protein GCM10025872_13580 [Barrientosiimonas endolithica]|uniref:Uncharacterized protein n=2 Tax=Barrientosiimonas endolithica TaxID=1535208 RepID=A0ABN6YL35_9MICO|nr:hypothetical protein GCM10025872_13580 [Barrientosiimonas endolithica]